MAFGGSTGHMHTPRHHDARARTRGGHRRDAGGRHRHRHRHDHHHALAMPALRQAATRASCAMACVSACTWRAQGGAMTLAPDQVAQILRLYSVESKRSANPTSARRHGRRKGGVCGTLTDLDRSALRQRGNVMEAHLADTTVLIDGGSARRLSVPRYPLAANVGRAALD